MLKTLHVLRKNANQIGVANANNYFVLPDSNLVKYSFAKQF